MNFVAAIVHEGKVYAMDNDNRVWCTEIGSAFCEVDVRRLVPDELSMAVRQKLAAQPGVHDAITRVG